jgi:hypothetical protein
MDVTCFVFAWGLILIVAGQCARHTRRTSP